MASTMASGLRRLVGEGNNDLKKKGRAEFLDPISVAGAGTRRSGGRAQNRAKKRKSGELDLFSLFRGLMGGR